jgi:site-specific DNA-methyltransferase (cytosine-N4-specific)
MMNMFGVGKGSRVLDPFCGSGTTLIEAAQMGADAIGTDLNPFAVFLANAKQTALHTPSDDLQSTLKDVQTYLRRRSGLSSYNGGDARTAYLKQWFDARQLQAIERVRVAIIKSCGDLAPIFLTIASDQLRDYSLQDPKDLRIRRRTSPLPDTPFEDAFLERASEVVKRIGAAQRVLGGELGMAQARLFDNTTIKAKTFSRKFDCAITSPPYAMALPYIDTQRLSLVWLGLAEPNTILSLESELIGSREMRGSARQRFSAALKDNPLDLPKAQLKFCRVLDAALSLDDGFRRQAVPSLLYRYFASMKQSFVGVKKAMKKGAPFALVVGHNHTTLGGKRFDIDTPKHLADLAVSAGWIVEEMLPLQTYQRFGYHAANAVEAETLVLLRNA